VAGWDPKQVFSESGVAEIDCIFVMHDRPHEAIWVITQWEPQAYFIEFLKVTPGVTVGRIEIRLRPGEANQTLADVSYAYTALSEAGALYRPLYRGALHRFYASGKRS
jgi:hypothetical protein